MNSIRRQLTRELLVVALLLFGAGWTALFVAARAALIEQFDRTLRAQALTVGALLEREEGRLELEAPDRLPAQFGARKPRAFFEVCDADGASVARSASLGGEGLPHRAVRGDERLYWNLELPNDRPGRAIALAFAPRIADSQRAATSRDTDRATIVLAVDREDLDETLGGLLAIAVASGALLLAATLWIVPRVLRRGLRPLDTLGEHVARIDASSLAQRFEAGGLSAELRPVAARLNDLLARLERSFEHERRVSADLAHELRTPIAELRTLAESALKWPDARDSATDRDALDVALHMEAIVGHMLALARSESGRLTLECRSIEVSALVEDVWPPFARRAESRGLSVVRSLAPATVATDAALLRSILANLFDNAVDYAPAGGEIALTCAATADGGVRVTVANTTDGLAPEDVEKLFERFWRKEGARTVGGHVGLGLPLVRAFAHALGWQVAATLDARRVLTFALIGKNTPAGPA